MGSVSVCVHISSAQLTRNVSVTLRSVPAGAAVGKPNKLQISTDFICTSYTSYLWLVWSMTKIWKKRKTNAHWCCKMRYLATWLSSMLWAFLCHHYLWTLRSQSQSDTDIIFSYSCCRKLVYDSVVWSSPVWFLSVDSFLSSFSITEILLLKFLGMSGTSHVTIVQVFFILPKHFHTVSSRSVDHLSSALSVLSVLF